MDSVEAIPCIDDTVIPRCFKPRPVPLALKGYKVETEPDRLQSQGVIKSVEHPDSAAPIVPVLNASGEVRICGNHKLTVNTAAKVVKHPIPNIDGLERERSS